MALLPELFCVLSIFACLLLFNADNKYTSEGPQARGGVLLLDEQTIGSYPVVYLVNGWEYHNGKLLTPADFARNPPRPDAYVFIGQHGRFNAGDFTAAPDGSASYRLNILLPDEVRVYTLELPEIYSAYKLYINGREAASFGDPAPDSYRPETGLKTVIFEARSRVEILIAATDGSHILNGMVNPPVFGETEAVAAVTAIRMIIRVAMCVVALTAALIAIIAGMFSRMKLSALLYGLMCLCLAAYTSYPIVRSLMSGVYHLHAAADFTFCAVLALTMLLQTRIYGTKIKWSRPFIILGLLVCIISVVRPFALPDGNLTLRVIYFNLIAGYKYLAAAYITLMAIIAAVKKTGNIRTLLCAILIVDGALVMDRLLPLHDPILAGSFPELACFALVICIGIAICKEIAGSVARKATAAERARGVEKLSDVQRIYYPLVQYKNEEVKAALLDLRRHADEMAELLDSGQYTTLWEYIGKLDGKVHEARQVGYSSNEAAELLAQQYILLAKENDTELTISFKLDGDIGASDEGNTGISDADLCALLLNLLDKAMNACIRMEEGDRFITLSAETDEAGLTIKLENSATGVIRAGDDIVPANARGQKGYGLDAIKAIAGRYNGTAEFSFDETRQVFTGVIILPVMTEQKAEADSVEDSEADSGTDSDTDSGTDADTDTDSGTDTEADAGTDAGTDTE